MNNPHSCAFKKLPIQLFCRSLYKNIETCAGWPGVVWQLITATGLKSPKQRGSHTSIVCDTLLVPPSHWASSAEHLSAFMPCYSAQSCKSLSLSLRRGERGMARSGPWPLSSADGQCCLWNCLMMGTNETSVFLRDVVKEEIEKEESNPINLSKASTACLMFPHIRWDLHSLSLLQKSSWFVLTP